MRLLAIVSGLVLLCLLAIMALHTFSPDQNDDRVNQLGYPAVCKQLSDMKARMASVASGERPCPQDAIVVASIADGTTTTVAQPTCGELYTYFFGACVRDWNPDIIYREELISSPLCPEPSKLYPARGFCVLVD